MTVDAVVAVHVGRHGTLSGSERTGKATFAASTSTSTGPTNLRNWESRVPMHAASRDYDLAGLAADPARLSGVVAYDRPWLGDLTGLDVVHLQCHIGTDTISLARLGGRVTGVDFSPSALAVARDLARPAASRRASWSRSCTRPRLLGDVRPRVHRCGRAQLAAGHRRLGRVVAACSARAAVCTSATATRCSYTLYGGIDDDVLRVTLPYFEGQVLHWVERRDLHRRPAGGLARAVRVEPRVGEIVQAVIDAGLSVTALREHPECEWRALPHMVEGPDGKFRLPEGADRLP